MRRYFLALFLFACPAPSAAQPLPETLLFQPLLADPRWPRFSGTMLRVHEGEQSLLWSANFGESFTFFGDEISQFGLQAGVFSLWDLKTESDDMINVDFLIGFPYTRRFGRLTTMARLFHVSTHLGDEYLLRTQVPRVNLSYEAVDVRGSWDFDGGWRAYGGGGYIYRRYPDDLKPGVLQLGGEWQSPRAYWRGAAPFAALDLQKRQDNGWGLTDVSARLGAAFSHRLLKSRRFLVYTEYYRGHNPNGQWFRRRYETMGAGVQLTF